MNKFIKFWIGLWIFGVFILPIIVAIIPGSSEESTGPNDYARITDVEYKAVLVDEPSEGGKVVITEILTYDVHAASKNNLYWELWRDLPEDYVDGLKVDYQVNYVKQLNEDGTETVYTKSPKLYWYDSDYTSSTYGPGKWYHSVGPYDEDLARYECVFFYVDGLYREKVTFEIQYEMNNAALRYNDVSELYLSMYSEETIKHLESFEGQILIPQKDMPSKGNYLAHTYGTNSHTFDYTESDTINSGYHTFSFNLNKDDLQFKAYNQYLEFSLLAFNSDRHIFTNYAPSNYYSDDDYLEEALDAIEEYEQLPAKAEVNKRKLFGVSTLISAIILIFVVTRDKRLRKKHNFYESSTQIQFFRDIPSDLDPHFAAALVFSKHKHKHDIGDSYSAILLNLVRKGYIELQRIDNTKDWVFNNISLKVLYNPLPVSTLVEPIPTDATFDNAYSSYNNIIEPGYLSLNNESNVVQTSTIENQINIPVINQQPQIIEPYNINGKKLEKLSTNEEAYFNLIVKHANNEDTISMEQFQQKVSVDYDNTDTFVTSIENSVVNIGISQGYFQKADYNYPKKRTNSLANKYLIFGFIILTIGNMIISATRLDFAYGALFILGLILIISAIYLKKTSKKYILLTQFGEDEYTKWRALYNFLNSETLMNERTVVELVIWEKYLVYATAFGISDKVIKALEIRCPDVANSPVLSNKYYRSSNFRTSNHRFRTATRSASSISRSSRYGGSYYGGGSRGGGGGGGGH